MFYADKEEFVLAKDSVRPGDVIRAQGAFEAEHASTVARACRGWTKGLRVSSLRVLEKWEPSLMGTFHLRTKGGAQGLCSAPDEPVTAEIVQRRGMLPDLILQCPDAYVDRVMSYLKLKYGGAVCETCPSVTEFSNTAERHILVSLQCAAAHVSLQNEILEDANLYGAITACWRFRDDGTPPPPANRAQARAFATTGELARWLVSPDRQLNDGSVRLQAFPSVLKRAILAQLEALASHPTAGGHASHHVEGPVRGLRLDPTAGADWVLSVVLADGCLMASAS